MRVPRVVTPAAQHIASAVSSRLRSCAPTVATCITGRDPDAARTESAAAALADRSAAAAAAAAMLLAAAAVACLRAAPAPNLRASCL